MKSSNTITAIKSASRLQFGNLFARDYMRISIGLCVLIYLALVPVWDVMAKPSHKATIIGADGTILQDDEARTVHIDDSLALVALYHSTNGAQWDPDARGGWLVEPVAFWTGVGDIQNVGTDVDPEWRVISINLPARSIRVPGPIPAEIGMMKYLRTFQARENLLSGSFPIELVRLEELRGIVARHNPFTGEVPWAELSALPHFNNIEVRASYFGGDIPNVNGGFQSLTRVNLAECYFTSLPSDLGTVEPFERLEAWQNRFTGEIPDLGDLENLARVRIHGNDFNPGPFPEWLNRDNIKETLDVLYLMNTNRTGTVPQWITEFNNLRRLGFGDPGLGGDLPDMSFMDDLNRLQIRDSAFEGPIPGWIANVVNLQNLMIWNTPFSGEIPPDIAAMGLEELYLVNVNLTGGLPLDLTSSEGLEELVLIDMPGLDIGPVPDWIGNFSSLNWLRLENVGLTGPIPQSWENLSTLEHFSLRNNAVTGPIPDWVQELPNLRLLDFSYTDMDIDEIPAWLADKTENLESLGLAGHGITGEIPVWMGDFFYMYVLSLADNELPGSIPASLGNLPFMDSLNLANNQLSGELPENFANIGKIAPGASMLGAIMLSGNAGLEGQISADFTRHPGVRFFEYDGTGLCADAPEFQAWFEAIHEDPYIRRPLSGYTHPTPPLETSVKKNLDGCGPADTSTEETERPYVFRLDQNYPNPFNPATTIRYEIPADGLVRLQVYNVIGQRVATLVNNHQDAGQHVVTFEATDLSSGSYIIRLETGQRVQTQTMMLVK